MNHRKCVTNAVRVVVAALCVLSLRQSAYAEPTACMLTITCPPNRVIQCHQSSAPSNTGTATFTANPDCGAVTLTHADAVTPGSCPQERTISRTWTATATSGDVATCVQTIVVEDTTAPQFPSGCNQNTTVQCVAQVPPPGLGGVGPFDLCDPTIHLTSVRTSNGGSGCVGDPLIITDTYTATDDCGNSSQCVRTYTVIDNTPPTITCPPDITITGAVPPCDPNQATASDNCGSVTVTCSDGPLVGDPCNGTITRTYVATDGCGNTASCIQILTVVDNSPPTIVCPDGFEIECPEDLPACDPDDATVTDGCGDVTVTCTDGPLVGGPCGGTITRTYLATDGAGNTASCDQIITVHDQTAPTITCPASILVECLEDVPACDPSNATVVDNCDAPVTVTCSDGPLIGGPCGGTIVRTFVATDACGNSASCTQTITIDDTTAPSISCPPALSVECASAIPACNPSDATVSDNCDEAVTVTCSDSPLSGDPCAGSIIRTYIATDACGNTATCDQIITVDDNTPPTISCPPSATVACGSDILACDPDDVTVTDNCDAPVTVTCSDSPISGDPCSGSVLRTYTATDACGNSVSCTQTINVVDNVAPTITCAPDITVQRILDLPPCNTGDVIADDNCSEDIVITCNRRGLGGIGCTDNPIPVTYTFTATDGCGNQATCTRIVTVLRPDCPFVVNAGDGPGPINAIPGSRIAVPLRVDTLGSEISSFDFALRYDKSAATVLGIERGDALSAWEHFTYRLETAADGSGIIRLSGIADLNDGPSHPHYTAYTPLGEIAILQLAISADPRLLGHSMSLRPCLDGCTDNTIVSRGGDMTFVMEESETNCASALGGSIVPGVRFSEIRLDIATPTQKSGDINLNGTGYEVGDVVVMTNYLINGPSSLSDIAEVRQVQMAAGDVNDDGIAMSVADLRYLLRIVSGETSPLVGKLSPFAGYAQAQFRVDNGRLSVSSESDAQLGAALFIFRYSGLSIGSPELSEAASLLTARASASNGELRVLLSPHHESMAVVARGQNELFAVPMAGSGNIELIEVQMSDDRGALLQTTAYKSTVPTDFALDQNYPNPFNAGTVIPFALREPSDWNLTIYNVMGQAVRTFSGHNEAGRIVINWNGDDDQGGSIASGVYFYRLQTSSWSATKKMLLVK